MKGMNFNEFQMALAKALDALTGTSADFDARPVLESHGLTLGKQGTQLFDQLLSVNSKQWNLARQLEAKAIVEKMWSADHEPDH